MAYLHQIEDHSAVAFDPQRLYKLLLNSWSAEYALSITPVADDADYQQLALSWQLPQAYYAGLFSAKALMFTKGFSMPITPEIHAQVAILAEEGFYNDQKIDRLKKLRTYTSSSAEPAISVPLSQVESTQKILGLWADEMMMAHERAICLVIGCAEYNRLVLMAPEYLQYPFSGPKYRARVILRELQK